MNSTNEYAIGLVVTGFDKGGLEQVVYNLYLGYKARGWKAFILCEKGELAGYFAGRLLDYRDLHIFEGDRDSFLSFCYRNRITHLHYHYQTFFLKDAWKFGIKTLYTIHNTYVWFNEESFRHYGSIVNEADAIVGVSSLVKQFFCFRGNVSPKHVQVITNGIDATELNLTNLPEHLTRKGLKVPEGYTTLCIPASILPSKHQIGMVGVMEAVVKKNPKVQLLIVGNIGDENYNKELHKQVDASTAKDNITIMPFFDHRYMGEFLRRTVDIFMLPTLYEGCSNAVLEATYCGKPMILTNVGNAQDMIGHSRVTVVRTAYEDLMTVTPDIIQSTSLIKTAPNCQALTDAILDNVDNLAAYTDKAAQYAKQNELLTMQTMIDSYCKLIESL